MTTHHYIGFVCKNRGRDQVVKYRHTPYFCLSYFPYSQSWIATRMALEEEFDIELPDEERWRGKLEAKDVMAMDQR